MNKIKHFIFAAILFGLTTNLYQADQFANGNSMLLWDAPTTNEDGTPLTDLAGYQLGIFAIDVTPGDPGVSPLGVLNVVNTNAVVSSVTTLALISEGRYRFAVLAVDTHNNKSLWSNVLDLDIKTRKPKSPGNVRCNS